MSYLSKNGKTKGKTKKWLKMGLYYILSYRLTCLTSKHTYIDCNIFAEKYVNY